MYLFCPSCKTKLVRKLINNRNYLACPSCDFIFWNNPKPTTSAILEKDGKILMIKRNQELLKGFWVLPGGFMEYEETPEETTVREVKEETGLKIQTKELVGVYKINDDEDPSGATVDIIFHGEILGGTLKIEKDFSDFRFFNTNNLPDLIAYKHRKAILNFKEKFL